MTVDAKTTVEAGDGGRARLILIVAMIGVAATARVLPHPWNFTPIGAMALFGGATIPSRRLSALAPLTALFLSDLLIGFHALMPVVYCCFLVNVGLGWWLRLRIRPLSVAGTSIAGSTVFFLVTNFACWVAFYEHSPAGLAACYINALPFFDNTLLGDLMYSALLFGGLALAENRFPALRTIGAAAPRLEGSH